jgi:hypothetical protein
MIMLVVAVADVALDVAVVVSLGLDIETPCTRRGEVRCLYIKVDTAVTIHASINYRYIYFKIPTAPSKSTFRFSPFLPLIGEKSHGSA